MNQKTLIGSSILVVIGIASAMIIYTNMASAAGFATSPRFFLTAGSGTATGAGEVSATSTKVFLMTGATASSTITIPILNSSQVEVNLRAVASSSAANLVFAKYYSDDGVDYYPVHEATTTLTAQIPTVIQVGEVLHSWNLSTTSIAIPCNTNEVCKHITIVPGYGRFLQIRFAVSGANAGVWGSAITKENIPN